MAAAVERGCNLVASMAAARSRRHSSDADDIRDPVGQFLQVYEEVGLAVAEASLPVLRRLADLIRPTSERDSGASPLR